MKFSKITKIGAARDAKIRTPSLSIRPLGETWRCCRAEAGHVGFIYLSLVLFKGKVFGELLHKCQAQKLIQAPPIIVKPRHQTPKPQSQKPKNPKPRGLGLTLKSYGPPTPPHPTAPPHHPTTPHITFEHEGGVPQPNSVSKNILEWSPPLVKPNKFQVDRKRKDMG